jgi:hypothetical protein
MGKIEEIIEKFHSSYHSDFPNEDLADAIRSHLVEEVGKLRKERLNLNPYYPDQLGYGVYEYNVGWNKAISEVIALLTKEE